MPDAEPTVAIEVLLLLHVPPGVASVNVSVKPIHTTQPVVGHGIGAGSESTVIVSSTYPSPTAVKS